MAQKITKKDKSSKDLSLALLIALASFAACETETSLEPVEKTQGGLQAKFSSIQSEILAKRCATSGCHSSEARSANLDLSQLNAYDNLVGVPALLSTSRLDRVEPGSSSQSFLIKVLDGSDPVQMPLGSSALDQQTVSTIAEWIDAGAKND